MDLYITLAYILSYIGIFATSFYIINLFAYYRKKQIPNEITNKKVSIIIPAFNEEEGIAKTIESALSLSYPRDNLEIIVIDDGSSDKTYEISKKFISYKFPTVKVFTKQNGGKGTAINKGIKEANGEIIITMDADTSVRSDALKKMICYFSNEKVMCVSPSMGIFKPKNIWQRIQQIEYHMGVFLRKSFASMNAIHVTPGAFSAYRKSFFSKYGCFDENNLTEDLEVALRIQKNNYIIENASEAVAYTISPSTFRKLLIQRKRWYVGLMKNLWNYRTLFGIKKGALGTIVLPTAVTTVALSVILTVYLIIRTLGKVKDELVSLSSINFQFRNAYELSFYVFENFFFNLFSNKIFLITLLFISLLWFYIKFSEKRMHYHEGMKINFVFFIIVYALIFAFWWLLSFTSIIFNKKVLWRENGKK